MKTILPQNVENILNRYKDLLLSEYAEELASVYLFGSLTYNDFIPAWSDIDVFVIISKPVEKTDLAKLKKTNNAISNYMLMQQWQSSQSIEGYLVEEKSILENICLPYIRFSEYTSYKSDEPINPFDRYNLSEKGFSYFGKTYKFAKPEAKELLSLIKKTAALELKPDSYLNFSSIRLTSIFFWIAQSIIFLRDKKYLPKTEALKREIEEKSRYTKAYELALMLRGLGTEATKDKYNILLKYYLEFREAAYNDILRYIKLY